MFTFIGCGVVGETNEDNRAMHLLIELFFLSYGILAALLNVAFIVVTIRTWRTVKDNIHVRGELILQTVVLLITYLILLLIWLCDVLLEDDNATLSDDGEELYDQVFNLGYFINSSVGSLVSIIVSTQYLPFREWQKKKSLSRRVMEKSGVHIADNSLAMDRTQCAFRAMIATTDGMEAFMKYLSKKNEQNYLIVTLSVRLHFSPRYHCMC